MAHNNLNLPPRLDPRLAAAWAGMRAEEEASRALEAERQAEAQLAREENERLRQEREAEIEREHARMLAEREEAFDLALAPRRERERRSWLASHPGQTDQDFDRVWIEYLRPNLREELAEAEREEGRQNFLNSPGPSRFTL